MSDVPNSPGTEGQGAGLRVAFFVDAFPDVSTTFIHNQVTGLLARGHQVYVFAQTPGRNSSIHPDVEQWNLRERTTYIGPTTGRLRELASLPLACLNSPSRALSLVRSILARSSSVAGSERLYAALRRLRLPLGCDIVHCHFGPNGNLAVRLRDLRILEAPILTTFHGYDMRQGEPSQGRIFGPLRLRGDCILSISGYNSRLLRSWGFDPNRIVEHRVGVDSEYFSFLPPTVPRDRAIRILSVGNLVPVKGHEYGVAAIARLRRKLPKNPVKLRIVGDGPVRGRLEDQIRAEGLTDLVEIVGALGRHGVREELREADLFLLPSLNEATPVVLMEAQATGLPVVATRVGAVEEVVLDGTSGKLVPPGDSEALATALSELVRDPASWAAMGRAGREHVEANYDIRELVTRLEKIYRSVRFSRTADGPSIPSTSN